MFVRILFVLYFNIKLKQTLTENLYKIDQKTLV